MSIDHRVKSPSLFASSNQQPGGSEGVTGEFRQIDGELWYRIANVDRMPPFFMSLISSEDHWMFLASNGAMTCGRRDANHALFPYYSADKLLDLTESTGPRTIIRLEESGRCRIWEPFSAQHGLFETRRSLYKNRLGSRLLFEETNLSLGLTFRYQWACSRRFGFVRTSELINLEGERRRLTLLDGLQNLLPPCIDQNFQLRFSNLADAYKKSELLAHSGLGIFYLNSVPTDRAEPSEGLQATVAWQTGLDAPQIFLSSRQLEAFRNGWPMEPEVDVRGQRHAYLLTKTLDLAAHDLCTWRIVADVAQDHVNVVGLQQLLEQESDLAQLIETDQAANDTAIWRFAAELDGLELGADPRRTTRHLSNTLFNAMRGGLPAQGYQLNRQDFVSYLTVRNRVTADRYKEHISNLPDEVSYHELQAWAVSLGDASLQRLASEFLPLTFGRRHGDPTRPWNQFRIADRDEAGNRRLGFEGNWRDLFQNWEALGLSYPQFLPGMVMRFVNASTADGYNPYRVNETGFDWERPDPADPWSNIGYWGDHQIVYLLKLLELTQALWPDQLGRMLETPNCVYANVPYRIAPFERLRTSPRETISYLHSVESGIAERIAQIGTDGQLQARQTGEIHYVTLLEKLLLTGLVKLSNFVPGGGVWLNTQRPEWNDAQNALAGSGASLVTVSYLRRYFAFLLDLLNANSLPEVACSRELADFVASLRLALGDGQKAVASCRSAEMRLEVVEGLQLAAEAYRESVYQGFSGDYCSLEPANICDLLQTALSVLDETLKLARRDDGLFHSFNLLHFQTQSLEVEHLEEMLEGQVAILESGLLSPEQASDLLSALRTSALYRPDQASYLLYPNRALPRYLEKNRITAESPEEMRLLNSLVGAHSSCPIRLDATGCYRFAGHLKNLADLREAVAAWSSNDRSLPRTSLSSDCPQSDLEIIAGGLAPEDWKLLEAVWERTFQHRRFTGRSTSFFAYEGLGSIYWHMVSKLVLAAARECHKAEKAGATSSVQLRSQFRELYDGMWLNKSPENYGAFPTDPYSHTPAHAGAQQPGMTGQVKEDLLTRLLELGIILEEGRVEFRPVLFLKSELLTKPQKFSFPDVTDQTREWELPEGSFAFSFCQTPIVYRKAAADSELEIEYSDGTTVRQKSRQLSRDVSLELFNRTGKIRRITVSIEFSEAN